MDKQQHEPCRLFFRMGPELPFSCSVGHFLLGIIASLWSVYLLDIGYICYQLIEHIVIGASDNVTLDLAVYLLGRIVGLIAKAATSVAAGSPIDVEMSGISSGP